MSKDVSSSTNPFTNIIQLEEITHFSKPHKPLKSILTNCKTKFQSKSVSYSPGIDVNEFSDSGERSDAESDNNCYDSGEGATKREEGGSSFTFMNDNNTAVHCSIFDPERLGPDRISYNSESEDESQSDTEFRRDFTQLPTTGREISSFRTGNQNDANYDNTNSNVNYDYEKASRVGSSSDSKMPEFQNNLNAGSSSGGFFIDRGISDENLFPLPNAIDVTRADGLFAFSTFLIHFLGICSDFGLGIWHYNTGFPWAAGLTFLFIGVGGIGMLQQFGIMQQDQLERTFRKGKRMRILVNCFPWAASSLVALEGTITSYRSLKDAMHSQQFFRICELQRSLSRVQSLFQSSILAVIQLTIWMENWSETSGSKGWMTFANLCISLAIMTCANLPCKTDSPHTSNKAAFLPLTRLFIGVRMFSSLGSRCMAVSFLLVGCRCILKYIELKEGEEFLGDRGDPTFLATLIGLFLLLFPRLVFTLTDFLSFRNSRARVTERFRDQPELGLEQSRPGEDVPLPRILTGYLATICFPVGDPFWLFWYLWAESGIFMVFGIVAVSSHACLGEEERWVLSLYVGLFLTTFLVVPCAIPAARAAVQRRKVERVRRVLQVGLEVDVGEEDAEGNQRESGENRVA